MAVVKHPLKALRELSGLSMAQVALYSGVSKQHVVRCEQGVFVEPPLGIFDLISEYLTDEDLISREEFTNAYIQWQLLQRLNAGAHLVLSKDFDFHTHKYHDESHTHPFTHWRLHSGVLSRITISKEFCVHPGLMYRFEKQPWLCSTPPGELLRALKVAGYPPELLSKFTEAYAHYRITRRLNP